MNLVFSKTTQRKFVCTLCGVDLREGGILNEHNKLHEGKVTNQCVYCNRHLSSRNALRSHTVLHVRMLFDEQHYQCEYCGITFVDKPRLKSHIDFVHNKVRPLECDICGFKLRSKNHLSRHMITHVRFDIKFKKHFVFLPLKTQLFLIADKKKTT